MPLSVRQPAALAGVLALLATAAPARAGFITYAFTSDSSDRGGSLVGGFRVDQADLLDGVLSTSDVRDYGFNFTDSSGGATPYVLSGVFPDLDVDPASGVPTGIDGSVLGDQVGDAGIVQAFLTSAALTPGASFWVANTQPSGETDAGFGHWEIAPEGVNPVPAPAGAVLGLVGVGCLAVGRLTRRRGSAG
jgi:hypothetical protein